MICITQEMFRLKARRSQLINLGPVPIGIYVSSHGWCRPAGIILGVRKDPWAFILMIFQPGKANPGTGKLPPCVM
jgi:hypothetical protein